MKLQYRVFLFAAGLLLSATVLAGSVAESVSVNDPYVRAMPPGQPTSAGFMGITNNSDKDQALVGAEGDIAKRVELHTHTMKDGMMRMHEVEKIDLPAGKMTMLQPGGLHVMLMGLKKDLIPGDKIAITLVFGDGSKKKLEVPVRMVQMKMKMDEKKGGMHHNH